MNLFTVVSSPFARGYLLAFSHNLSGFENTHKKMKELRGQSWELIAVSLVITHDFHPKVHFILVFQNKNAACMNGRKEIMNCTTAK